MHLPASVNATPRCLTPKTNCSQFLQSKFVSRLRGHPVHLLYRQVFFLASNPSSFARIGENTLRPPSPQSVLAATVASEPRTPSQVIPHYWRLPWLLRLESLDSLSSSPVVKRIRTRNLPRMTAAIILMILHHISPSICSSLCCAFATSSSPGNSYSVVGWRAYHSGLLHVPIALGLDLQCLRSIIWSSKLLEPWVLQRLLCCDTLRWIVNEDPSQKVKEVTGEVAVRWNYLLHYMLVLVLAKAVG